MNDIVFECTVYYIPSATRCCPIAASVSQSYAAQESCGQPTTARPPSHTLMHNRICRLPYTAKSKSESHTFQKLGSFMIFKLNSASTTLPVSLSFCKKKSKNSNQIKCNRPVKNFDAKTKLTEHSVCDSLVMEINQLVFKAPLIRRCPAFLAVLTFTDTQHSGCIIDTIKLTQFGK